MTITGNNGASTRSTASSASRGMSWMYMKEEAKKAYNRGDYVGALDLYKACISSSSSSVPPPAEERQLILSNIVACRLQIGGPEQAEVAIETAKQCIAINPRYAKGHVRLASAYIAFGEATGHRNEYSNDACNALQRAVQLDRGNKQARDMLLRELRRDHRNDNNNNNNNESNRSTTATTTSHPPPSAPPQDLDDRDYHDETNRSSGTNNNNNTSNYSNRSYTDNNYSDNNNVPPSNNQQQQQQHRSQYQDQPQDEGTRYRHHNENIDIDIHTFTWQDRVQFYYQRLVTWYSGQSNDIRTILKFMLVLVLLYVAFGGRFGLSSASSLFNQQPKERKYRGNYGAGNVYDQHYGRYSASSSSSSSSSSYSSSSYPYTSADNNNRYDSRRTGSTSSRQPDDYRYHSDRYNNDNTGSRSGRSDYYRDDYSYGNDRQYEEQRRRRRSSNSSYSSTSYHFPNLMDGSLPSMMVLAGLVYIGYRAGINPFQLLFFINIMGGRRRRPHGYHHGFGGGFRRRW